MNQEKIGKFILELRKEKKLSQLKLAEKIGVTDRAISKWENGRGLPDLTLMKPLCDELGITINELLSGERLDQKDYQNKLEENIINAINYQKKNTIRLVLYYIIVFFTGIFIVPTLLLVSPTFILSGILAPIFGLIKLIGYIFGFDVPFVRFQLGNLELNPIIGCIFSIILGIILFILGKCAWKVLVKYVKRVIDEKEKLK